MELHVSNSMKIVIANFVFL